MFEFHHELLSVLRVHNAQHRHRVVNYVCLVLLMVLHEVAEQRLVLIDECLDVGFVWKKNHHESLAGDLLLGDLVWSDFCAIV